MRDFRADVPASLKGGTVVGTKEAERLWTSGDAIFIDVMPQPPKPKSLPAGTVWRSPKRDTIPGSHWLPNVGFGELSADVEAYFRDRLHELSGGDASHTLVVFCLSRCWMSWNAAKRAISLGHTNVIWYPDGTDGWETNGLRLEKTAPVK